MRKFRIAAPGVALAALATFGCGEPQVTERIIENNHTTEIIREVPVYPDAGTPGETLDCAKQVYSLQPVIEARSKGVITVDGKQFKDLNGSGSLDAYEDWRLLELCRARDLLAKMTVPQKVGLMSEGGTLGNGTSDGVLADQTKDRIVTQHVRQALVRFNDNITAKQLAVYINNLEELAEAQPLGIPVVMTADPIHGIVFNTNGTSGANSIAVTRNVSHWPQPLGLGAINDIEVTRQHGLAVRQEFMGMGFRWQLGPLVDLATEPRWMRVRETFGENALPVSKHSVAMVEAMQNGRTGDLRKGIAATAKHFPGAGPNEDGMDSHSFLGRYNAFPGGMFSYHLIPFQAVFDINIAALMANYSIAKAQYQWNPLQVPAGFSRELITELGKNEMGFKGMVTGDWGTATSRAWGIESLTNAERGALWLKAGSHQFGSDPSSFFQEAHDQGLVTGSEIDAAAEKILEMSFKLGLFEDPYVDPEQTDSVVRTPELRTQGFNAQKRAIVLLTNNRLVSNDAATTLLPIAGARSILDTTGDGKISVYFDGVTDALSGSDQLDDVFGAYDYKAASGTGTFEIAQATGLADADIAIIRVSARKGARWGLDKGVPLSFDAPFTGWMTDAEAAMAIKDRNKVVDAFRVRDGYKDSNGNAVAATNPKLKIVVVMYFERPGIVKGFVNGLLSLDELAGQPGSYPLVSAASNIRPDSSTRGIDALLVDFGAYDRAVLDFVFNKNPPVVGKDATGAEIRGYGRARLPMEIPSADDEVEAQFEDVPQDTKNPQFRNGAGLNL